MIEIVRIKKSDDNNFEVDLIVDGFEKDGINLNREELKSLCEKIRRIKEKGDGNEI